MPQSGSGTFTEFTKQLKLYNGGVDVVVRGDVVTVQEHDDTLLKNDPNAVAPFSTGRAQLFGGTVDLVDGEGSWLFERAMYNVVRDADKADADILALFGEDGFICSPEAQPLVEAAGFRQLATPANGGVCGELTQTATTNLATNDPIVVQETTTEVAGGATAQTVNLNVVVSATDGVPTGSVALMEGETQVATQEIAGGAAFFSFASTPGAHTYSAVFTTDDDVRWVDSVSATHDVQVAKYAALVTVKGPSSVLHTAHAKFTTIIKANAIAATGKVKIVNKKTGKILASGTLVNGKLVSTLPRLKAGKYTLLFKYLGSSTVAKKTVTKTLTVK
jgi:hypothetical protein